MRIEVDTLIDVMLDRGIPTALAWSGAEWRAIDEPTPLREEFEWLHPLITHAPDARRIGWRFTARCSAQDEVRTFDILDCGTGWRLQNVWD